MDTVILEIEDILKTSDKAVLFKFKEGYERWVSRKYFEPIPHNIIVPRWYYDKFIKPTH